MAVYIGSYFLGPKPVLFTQMHWRDENRTIDLMTSETVGGRRSLDRDLFILSGPSPTTVHGIRTSRRIHQSHHQSLQEAHVLALRKLLYRERDPAWRDNLQRALADVTAGK